MECRSPAFRLGQSTLSAQGWQHEFAGPAADLIYSEGMVGYIYLDRPEDLARYHECFEHLSQIALKPDQSAELIRQTSQAYVASVRSAS